VNSLNVILGTINGDCKLDLARANFNQSTESLQAQGFQAVRAEDHGPKHRGCRTRGHGHKQQFNDAYVELKRENFLDQFVVPDRDCIFGDVVLGYESIDSVRNGQGSIGAFIGRYANRIGGGTFALDGTSYTVAINEPAPKNNVLHGGAQGGRFRVYDAVQLSDSRVQVGLTYLDAEDADLANGITGFPGTLEVKVVRSVTDDNELRVAYSAEALDRKTVLNLRTTASAWSHRTTRILRTSRRSPRQRSTWARSTRTRLCTSLASNGSSEVFASAAQTRRGCQKQPLLDQLLGLGP
jgi:hypothetical protein